MKTKHWWWLFFGLYIFWIVSVAFHVPYNPYGIIWCSIQFMILIIVATKEIDAKLSEQLPKNPIPEEGRRVRMTWIKHARNVPSYVPNAYIGMEGIVTNVKPDGSFDLHCDNSWLIVGTEYAFEYID